MSGRTFTNLGRRISGNFFPFLWFATYTMYLHSFKSQDTTAIFQMFLLLPRIYLLAFSHFPLQYQACRCSNITNYCSPWNIITSLFCLVSTSYHPNVYFRFQFSNTSSGKPALISLTRSKAPIIILYRYNVTCICMNNFLSLRNVSIFFLFITAFQN